ncbi:MAG: DUF262 domain-containing protein [Chitinophagia bacterium]|nr:DUF262 domain-containing protein [Chitinophagia bacterium]
MQNQPQNLTALPISGLNGLHFHIPAYQRGYRWDKEQVLDLLNDINEFKKEDNNYYCLQPLVVKLREDKISYEVIDGQQRLTTILLIAKYFSRMEDYANLSPDFTIDYETREGFRNYLNNLNNLNIAEQNNANIDYFFANIAVNEIRQYLGGLQRRGTFFEKFTEDTRVIWYEIAAGGEDPIRRFMNLNGGKIPLTNAELIKALLLKSSSKFDNHQKEIHRLRQFEIAKEWDDIEYALQNKEFWYFLTNDDPKKQPTKIEFIFKLITQVEPDLDSQGKAIKSDGSDFFIFNYFKRKLEPEDSDIVKIWGNIKRYYQILHEWFTDRELYHKIGYLIASGTTIQAVIVATNNQTKTEAKKTLNNMISSSLNKVQLDSLEFKEKSQVKKVLLLHNIQTMLNAKEENGRFPFDRFQTQAWDVEHIVPQTEDMPKTEQHQLDWLTASLPSIGDEQLKDEQLKEDITAYITQPNNNFGALYNRVLNYFSENGLHEDDDNISNLVLLDSGTNRAYKNAVFPVKRKTIIDREKGAVFIPVCTKNVFMKYYSPNINQMTFWSEADANAYLKDIAQTLEGYLPEQQTNNKH